MNIYQVYTMLLNCRWSHLCTFALILCKNALIFRTYLLQLIGLILCKFILSVRNNFTNDEHVFLRILVTNLRVLCFDIYAIPTMCTPYYQNRLNLVSEICLVNILTFFGMRCHCYILVEIIYESFNLCMYIHCNIKCF